MGLSAGIHNEDHRELESGCNSCAAAITAWTDAIEEAHDPFHHRQISRAAMTEEAASYPVLTAEAQIQVATGAPRCSCQQLWVQIVRPHLERLNALPLLAGPGDQAEREQGLATAAGWRGD